MLSLFKNIVTKIIKEILIELIKNYFKRIIRLSKNVFLAWNYRKKNGFFGIKLKNKIYTI